MKILQDGPFNLPKQWIALTLRDRSLWKGLSQDAPARFRRRIGQTKEMEQTNPFGTGPDENMSQGSIEEMVVKLKTLAGLMHPDGPQCKDLFPFLA